MQTRFASNINLPDTAKRELTASLNVALATALDLQLQVKQAHWNVKGPQFFARHELFDRLAEGLRAAADNFAERASALGGYARGTTRQSAANSVLPEYDLDASDGRRHIQVLAERFGKYDELLREAIADAEKLRDPATADLFTEALRQAELDMWFLESHLQT